MKISKMTLIKIIIGGIGTLSLTIYSITNFIVSKLRILNIICCSIILLSIIGIIIIEYLTRKNK